MCHLYMLTTRQMAPILMCFPLSRGIPSFYGGGVMNGIINVIKNSLHGWMHPRLTGRILRSLAQEGPKLDRIMIDGIHLNRTAANLPKGRGYPRRIGRINSRLHAVNHQDGRPAALYVTEGQMSDHVAAKFLYQALPETEALLSDQSNVKCKLRNALHALCI